MIKAATLPCYGTVVANNGSVSSTYKVVYDSVLSAVTLVINPEAAGAATHVVQLSLNNSGVLIGNLGFGASNQVIATLRSAYFASETFFPQTVVEAGREIYLWVSSAAAQDVYGMAHLTLVAV